MKQFDTPMNSIPGGGGGASAAPARDGQLQVALAVKRVSQLVQVDPTQTPFATVPDGLFLLTFDDPKVGISDQQMAFFKTALKGMLPEIGATIDAIAEDASQIIGGVGRIVMLAEAAL
jgi:hypothetical protein